MHKLNYLHLSAAALAFAALVLTGVEIVPEPASLSLLGAALAGMGLFGWLRVRRNQSLDRTLT